MSDDTMTPCPSIAFLRKTQGLSQEDMARAIKTSRRQYQRYENSGQAPRTIVTACAEYLVVPEEDLRKPAGQETVTLVSLVQQYRKSNETLTVRHRRACERVRAKSGDVAYIEARERVVAARPEWAPLLPDTGTGAP